MIVIDDSMTLAKAKARARGSKNNYTSGFTHNHHLQSSKYLHNMRGAGKITVDNLK